MGMKVTPEEFTKEFLVRFATRAMEVALLADRAKRRRNATSIKSRGEEIDLQPSRTTKRKGAGHGRKSS